MCMVHWGCMSWKTSGKLLADMRQTLQRVLETWLISTPIMGAQLALATAAENKSFIVDDAFAIKLPLV
jgi:hypothetical protein